MPSRERPARLVVTGNDGEGRSHVASIEDVPQAVVALAPGWRFGRLWADLAPPAPDRDGRRHDGLDYYPARGELRAGTFTIPPDGAPAPEAVVPAELLLAEAEHLLPGALRYHDPLRPGFHTTPTLDMLVVLEGRVRLLLDAGEVELAAGDVVVQRGTAHAWSNPADKPAEVFFVMLGTDAKASA